MVNNNLAIWTGVTPSDGAGDWHVWSNTDNRQIIGWYRTANEVSVNATLRPRLDNTYSLGTSSQRYTTVFAVNGAINTSDERAKTDIREMNKTDALTFINRLKPVSYRMKDDPQHVRIGVIAQQVLSVLSSMNTDAHNHSLVHQPFKQEEMYGVAYHELIGYLIASVQELTKHIKELKKE